MKQYVILLLLAFNFILFPKVTSVSGKVIFMDGRELKFTFFSSIVGEDKVGSSFYSYGKFSIPFKDVERFIYPEDISSFEVVSYKSGKEYDDSYPPKFIGMMMKDVKIRVTTKLNMVVEIKLNSLSSISFDFMDDLSGKNILGIIRFLDENGKQKIKQIIFN